MKKVVSSTIKLWITCVILSVMLSFCGKSKGDLPENQPEIEQEAAKVDLGVSGSVTLKMNESIQISPVIKNDTLAYSFSWKLNGSEVSKEQSYRFEALEVGDHSLKLTATNSENKILVDSVNIAVIKNSEFKVMGYLPGWSNLSYSSGVKWEKLTHVFYAFITVNSEGSINDTEVKYKISGLVENAHNNGVAVLISVGGAGNAEFSPCILNSESRTKLVKNLIDFAIKYKLDGIDLDYEEWDGSDQGASEKDLLRRSALENLYKELRAQLPKDKLLTAAVNASWTWYANCFNNTMHTYLDYVGLMIYDNTGTWAESPYGQHAGYNEHFLPSINHWLNVRKLPKAKLVAGVPFYGYTFKNTDGGLAESIRYIDILSQNPGIDAYLSDQIGNTFYNGTIMIKNKAKYIKDNNLGGIMIWEITQDSNEADKSLLDVIAIELL